jgi:hypothetical protein
VAKRGIDMLPLLDVFMVVLFVFATIQEQQLDSSAQELADATAALAAAEAAQATLIDLLAASTIELGGANASMAAMREREAKLRAQLDEYVQECGPRQQGGPACPAANTEAAAAAEVVATHQRLLSRLAVFEIQLDGDPDLDTGELRTRCCYRAEPPEGAWRSCGQVPSDRLERSAWLEAGADGLVDGLADTQGSVAVVLLSQDRGARFLASDDLAVLLRQRFPDHRVYDDGSSETRGRCPDGAANPE